MSTKLRATTRYLLLEQLKQLAQGYLALLVIFVILPLLVALVTGNITNFNLLKTVGNFSLGAFLALFLFILNVTTYDVFKLLIQNGIARRTYWAARMICLVVLSVLGEAIVALYYYGVYAPMHSLTTQRALSQTAYSLYADFLGKNLAVNLLAGAVFSIILYILIGTAGMLIGSFLALFSKWVQWLIIIIFPFAGFSLLMVGISNVSGYSNYDFSGVEAFFKFLIGYPQNATAGLFNPTVPTITLLLLSAVMAALAYYCSQHLKIKQ